MRRICLLLLSVAAFLFVTNPLSAAETKFSGVIFGNWTLHLNDQGLSKNYNYFDITRARLIVDHQFSDKYSANMMLDLVPRDTADPSADRFGLSYRLRSAYIQGDKLVRYTTFRLGLQGIMWFDKLENFWGLRYIDKVSLDKFGYLDRADFGVSAIMDCPGNYGTVALQIFNGSGYAGREANRNKDFVGFASFNPMPKNPDFGESSVWFQYYKGWPNIANTAPAGESFHSITKRDRLQLAGAFKYRKWATAVAEYFHTSDDNIPTNLPGNLDVQKAKGVSLLGKLNVATAESWLARVYIFAKYDWIDKNLQLDKSLEPFASQAGDARGIIGGVGYEPVDGLNIALSISRLTTKLNDRNIAVVEDERNSFVFNFSAAF